MAAPSEKILRPRWVARIGVTRPTEACFLTADRQCTELPLFRLPRLVPEVVGCYPCVPRELALVGWRGLAARKGGVRGRFPQSAPFLPIVLSPRAPRVFSQARDTHSTLHVMGVTRVLHGREGNGVCEGRGVCVLLLFLFSNPQEESRQAAEPKSLCVTHFLLASKNLSPNPPAREKETFSGVSQSNPTKNFGSLLIANPVSSSFTLGYVRKNHIHSNPTLTLRVAPHRKPCQQSPPTGMYVRATYTERETYTEKAYGAGCGPRFAKMSAPVRSQKRAVRWRAPCDTALPGVAAASRLGDGVRREPANRYRRRPPRLAARPPLRATALLGPTQLVTCAPRFVTQAGAD